MISRLLPILVVCVASALSFAKGVFQCFVVIYILSFFCKLLAVPSIHKFEAMKGLVQPAESVLLMPSQVRWGEIEMSSPVSVSNSSNSLLTDCKRKHLNIQVAPLPLYEDVGRANSINPFGKAGQRNTRLAFLRHNRE